MAQVSYAGPGQNVPDYVQQQAASYDLGELVATYKPRYSNVFYVLGVSLGGIIADILVVVVLYQSGWIAFYLLVVPIFILVWAAGALNGITLRAYAFTNGLISARGRQSEIARWDQVQAVWEKAVRKRNGVALTYTVQRSDGNVFKFGWPLLQVRDLGKRLMTEVVKLHLPGVKAAYDAGQPLTFGPINVDRQGLNNGKEMVPWSQIGNLTTNQGRLVIEKGGQRLNWSSAASESVPNLSVLIALVRYVVQTQK